MTTKSFKEQAKEWWDEHKRAIKVGAVCLMAGGLYGFVKGVNTMTDMISRCDSLNGNTEDDDSSVLTVCDDDPEWLELIRLEEESLQKEESQ